MVCFESVTGHKTAWKKTTEVSIPLKSFFLISCCRVTFPNTPITLWWSRPWRRTSRIRTCTCYFSTWRLWSSSYWRRRPSGPIPPSSPLKRCRKPPAGRTRAGPSWPIRFSNRSDFRLLSEKCFLKLLHDCANHSIDRKSLFFSYHWTKGLQSIAIYCTINFINLSNADFSYFSYRSCSCISSALFFNAAALRL